MKKSFTTEQIAAVLRQAEGGAPVAEVIRRAGITEQTFSRWKRKFAGMGVAELRRLRQLEDENKKLKSLVADLTLDKPSTPRRKSAKVIIFLGFCVTIEVSSPRRTPLCVVANPSLCVWKKPSSTS